MKKCVYFYEVFCKVQEFFKNKRELEYNRKVEPDHVEPDYVTV